ncbi:MAG: DtxR family transcriptional regulator [Dissulfurimicrobium sp.]|uniref:metal-dependent transcriptional regulator n=1 Tax=Dissulfurimicrobium TaxID=1769732 RepID=UPI001EDB833C|nr:DtxR family transcriptional regulator [Dissulfurimicrobium hydrothermale]UKL14102.1 DtxR family transcriptional regulator [Dissulfurimicrobium hydrothermale]
MIAADTLTASLEDYLEGIFHIITEKQAARPKDIARRLKVGNSSVTGALRALADKGLINYAPHDLVTLTQSGKAVAKDIVRRHEVLRDFFVNVLAVDYGIADKTACQMEHAIPKVILERLSQFIEFVETCPRGGTKWLAGFGYYCDQGRSHENCEECISTTLEAVKKHIQQGGKKSMANTNLKALKPGQKGRVIKIRGRGETNKRIAAMGITPGSLVEVERVAPLGDPVDVKVKGYHLSLRKDDAESIEVELIE